jgi:sigma-B regulation protein RsbU (phosphoserine phosphatase)
MNSIKNHKYWIAAAVVLFAAILILYPYGIYNSLTLETTRPEAIKIAEDFLQRQGYDLTGFFKDAFIDNSPVENKYLLKQLGTKEFKKIQNNSDWALRGWSVMIYQNLSKELPQTSYTIDISHDGKVLGFKRSLPNTKTVTSLNEKQAAELITNYINTQTQYNLGDYKPSQTKQDNLGQRIDYTFQWDKKSDKVEGKHIIYGYVQGILIGGFQKSFEVPEAERKWVETSDALYAIVSVICVILLMMLAFFLFLKKYHQGEVWLSLGRNIFIVIYSVMMLLLVNNWPGIGQDLSVGNLSFFNSKIIGVILDGAVLYLFLALLIFASWVVGESYARSLWPEKLKGIDGFIKGRLTSIDTGSSLMKGMVIGIGYALMNMVIPLILNKPHATIFITPNKYFMLYIGYFPAAFTILASFVTAILSSIAVTFFIINISYQRWKKKWTSICIAGIVTMLVSVIVETPPSLNNLVFDLISFFIFGCAIGYIYFLFDILTIVSMFFYASLICNGTVLFNGHNPVFQMNFIVLILVFAVVPVIYIISRIRKKEFVMENFGLPSHIQRISERERLKKELEIAAKVQLSLLPKEEPKIDGYDISAISIPAVEAGGDYFDFVKLSGDKLGIAIGDVSGKGIGAAIYMTLTKGILQAHAEEDVSPKNVLGKVNRLLYKTIEKNSFVSMFYAILDTNKHTLLYSRAGHNPGILCSSALGETKLLLSKGMALGLEEGSIFTSTLKEEEIGLSQGDVFVLYTDGFTEAMNERHEEYSEERLIKLIEHNRKLSARDLISLITKEVKKFVDNYPQHDDMTILVVKRI